MTSPDDCIAGRVQCVDKIIRQMTKRFEPLASSCDHDAIFALTYLRVTEEYRRTVESPTFFDDTPFVNHEDVVFARYYFAAYDAWTPGRRRRSRRRGESRSTRREIGPFPRTATCFSASTRTSSATSRSFSTASGSSSRTAPAGKPDHDRVNQILNRVTDDVIAEIARRFDPTIDDSNLPTTLDDFGLFQAIVSWRETAWRHAELLALAPTPEARELVAREIEGYAASQARVIRLATVPAAPGQQRRARRLLRDSLGGLRLVAARQTSSGDSWRGS